MLQNQTQTSILASTDTVVLGGNMRRKGLVVGTSVATPTWINIGRPASGVGGAGVGYQIANGQTPLVLGGDVIGDSITSEVHAFSGAAAVITCTEYFGP